MNSPTKTGSTSTFSPHKLPDLASTLGKFLASRGIEAYVVGGAVRDAVLDRETRDIDVAVVADSQGVGNEIASRLGGRLVLLDEARDIVRVVVGGSQGAPRVDITSIRDGILSDLKRRDFTVDAMAVPLGDAFSGDLRSELIDPCGGLSDLRAGLIRAVSPSVFEADPARLMRAPRLAAQLRFDIAEETEYKIQRQASLVSMVAPERVRDELLQLIAQPGATASLRRLDRLELLCEVMPELAESRGVTQPKEHHWDVFNHLLEASGKVEEVVQREPGADGYVVDMVPRFESIDDHFAEEVSDGHTRLTLLKLAGLLHDVAKPSTKTVESSGRIRFLSHHTRGAEMTLAILKRLRLSGRGVELVHLLVHHHLRPSQMAQKDELPTGKAIYRYYRDLGDAAIDTLYLNMADYLAARGPQLRRREWQEHCRVIGHILREGREQEIPESHPMLIDGHDVMQALSLSPGPKVGALLSVVHEAQAVGDVATREEALELARVTLGSEGSGA